MICDESQAFPFFSLSHTSLELCEGRERRCDMHGNWIQRGVLEMKVRRNGLKEREIRDDILWRCFEK